MSTSESGGSADAGFVCPLVDRCSLASPVGVVGVCDLILVVVAGNNGTFGGGMGGPAVTGGITCGEIKGPAG